MRRWILPLVLTGCATAGSGAPPAPSVERVAQEAQVCGDTRSLRAGDSIQFQRRVCAPLNAKSSIVRCTVENVERGEVVRRVDERCAIVRVAGSFVMQPADTWVAASAPLTSSQPR